MAENNKDERLAANTRIVTDHGIDNLQPADDIHQEIYNEIIPPGGYDESRPVEYTYHRVTKPRSSLPGKVPAIDRQKKEPVEDIKGCQCEEYLRKYCHGTDWCNCCTSKSNTRSSSSRRREELKMPNFSSMGLFGNSGGSENGRRSSNGGRESTRRNSNSGGASHQPNVNSRSSGNRRESEHLPKESSIGSKHYTGGERGERSSRENCESYHRQRRRSSRVDDDDICEDFPVSPRTNKRTSNSTRISRESDCMNRNKWVNAIAQRRRCSTVGNNFKLLNEAPDETEESDQDEDHGHSYNNHCSLQTCCPPTHRLSIELSPVSSASTCDRRRSREHISNKNTNTNNCTIFRRVSDTKNGNFDTTKQRQNSQNNNDKICFDLTLECADESTQQDAGDVPRQSSTIGDKVFLVGKSSKTGYVLGRRSEKAFDSSQPDTYGSETSGMTSAWTAQSSLIILVIVFLWLLVLSVTVLNQTREDRYTGIYA